jgi:hypothetical protein
METMEMRVAREHVAELRRDAAAVRPATPRVPRPTVREEAGAVARGTRAGLRIIAGRARSLRPAPAVDGPEACCA